MESPRHEIKMVCDESTLPDLHVWINLHPEMFVEAYPPRRVNSIYFDSYEGDCLDDNLDGVSDRRKLRFRWYGEDHAHARGTLELKCKESRVGWKVLQPIPVVLDLTTLSWSEIMGLLRQHADGLVGIWLSAVDQPVVINSYMREYYESVDHQLRVTADYDLVAYEQVMYCAPNLVVPAPAAHQIVVEVKADAVLHTRVSDALSSFPWQVGRNSKYVTGTMDALCYT